MVVTEIAASPSPAAAAVYVLSPVGLNVRQAPDPGSERVTTLAQGARLEVLAQQQAAGGSWLRVRTQFGQLEGFVLDQPDLLIHREVARHVEAPAGYSNLFPADWQLKSGNPATMTAPSGEPAAAALLIQYADDITRLPSTPSAPGRELREEAPVEVYGKTTFLTVYALDAGGQEYSVRVKFEKMAYLFDYRQAEGQPDTALFKQLLASVIVP